MNHFAIYTDKEIKIEIAENNFKVFRKQFKVEIASRIKFLNSIIENVNNFNEIKICIKEI